jgi:uncharacterized protein
LYTKNGFSIERFEELSPMNALPPSDKSTSLRLLIARHPYTSALTFVIIFTLVAKLLGLILGLLFRGLHLSFLAENLVAELLAAMLIAILITIPHWWSEAGFTRGFDRYTSTICLGAILLIGLPTLTLLPSLIGKGSPSSTVMAIVLALLVGFVEEGLFRGLMACILLPKGILIYVILSSILFASIHITNLFSGFPLPYVTGQIILAFGSGILFAAIRLRTGSIWPTILLHALRDVGGLLLLAINPKQALSAPLNLALTVNSIYSVLFIINAAILLRPSKLHQLHNNYGIIPQASTLPANEEQNPHQTLY